MKLLDIPMETFQVLVGRRHQLALEVDGITYELLLGNEAEAVQQARERSTVAAAAAARAAAAASTAAASQALPAGAAEALSYTTAASFSAQLSPSADGGDGDVAPLQRFNGPRSSRSLELPETTLTGPLELVLREPEPVGIFSPFAADVGGYVRRVVVEAGATVRVAGLRRVTLRRPVSLARLPGQYLAEVYAQAATGQEEEGFSSAPAITYMAAQLRKAALVAANKSSSTGSGGSSSKGARQQRTPPPPPPPLLGFDVETVERGSLTITSAPELPPECSAAAAPRLKVRRRDGGVVELSLRQGQVTPAEPFNPAAVAHTWAWPLPHAASSSWLPYETLLRSVLADHPFDVDRVVRRGIGLRLTKSSIQGVHLIAFDMEVRTRQERPAELEGTTFEWNEWPLEVWEAVVQVQPQPPEAAGSATGSSGGGSGGGYSFVPLQVKRKQSYQNTVTVSRSSLLLLLSGGQNATRAGADGFGYDEEDLGIAASAP